MASIELRRHKQAARAWLVPYTEEQLTALLAHAQSGRLAYCSCCCLIGSRTADHALKGVQQAAATGGSHYQAALRLAGASDAETAFLEFGGRFGGDALRRRRIIPIIRAELRRREREQARLAHAHIAQDAEQPCAL